MSAKDMSTPISIIMGKLDGVSRKDAKEYCQNIIEKYVENPDAAFYRIKKHNDDYLYEIHEGGEGKSYLESLLEHIEVSEEPCEVIMSSATGYLKVVSDGGFLTFHLLPNNQDLTPTPGIEPKKAMTPNLSTGKHFLVIGLSTLVMSLGAVVAASSLHLMNFSEEVVKQNNPAHFDLHRVIGEMETLRQKNPDKYIKKMSFESGSWTIETGDVEVNYIDIEKNKPSQDDESSDTDGDES